MFSSTFPLQNVLLQCSFLLLILFLLKFSPLNVPLFSSSKLSPPMFSTYYPPRHLTSQYPFSSSKFSPQQFHLFSSSKRFPPRFPIFCSSSLCRFPSRVNPGKMRPGNCFAKTLLSFSLRKVNISEGGWRESFVDLIGEFIKISFVVFIKHWTYFT